MPRTLLAAAVAGCLLSGGPARAGLYNPREPLKGPAASTGKIEAIPFGDFRRQLSELIAVNAALPSGAAPATDPTKRTLRDHYLSRLQELETRGRTSRLTPDEQVARSAYLIRFRKYNEAINLLTPLARQERGNFLLVANLATAHELNGELREAYDYLLQIKGRKPPGWPGLTPEQVAWLGRVEGYHQRLIELRFRESRGGTANRPPEHPDDLFEGVRFTGPDGKYEAGRLPDQQAKLPPDAVAIVQQLLIWLPDDSRLYWLLGELLNAQGDIRSAAEVFRECVDAAGCPRTQLQDHRRALKEAVAKATPPPSELEPPPPESGTARWLPDREHLLIVGGIFGAVLALLAYFQVREFRHRRRGRPAG